MANDIVNVTEPGFKERIEPKSSNGLLFFKCPSCGGIHFRHAGYVKLLIPFIRPGNEKRVDTFDHQVMICVSCKKSFAWINEQMYDISDQIDLKAWEKTEKEAHKATGPGGQC